jgi:dihydrofolate synthase / folylpolyglutamate synthase
MEFLRGHIDYERTRAVPYDAERMSLARMRRLLDRLGNPLARLPVVHVAGTKGKGSTAATIAAVLSAAGYRTGLFTSPHLERIEERIIIDGRPCSPGELAELVTMVRPAVEELDRSAETCGAAVPAAPAGETPAPQRPTYFEIITALALVGFVRRQADVAVLEVGLGGRLDATNVCTPVVSVITSISLDHTQLLGDTLAAIAAEKAGIIKPGVPVVSGVTSAEPRAVIQRTCREQNCRLVELGADFDFDYEPPRHLELADACGRLVYRSRERTGTICGEAAGTGTVPIFVVRRAAAAQKWDCPLGSTQKPGQAPGTVLSTTGACPLSAREYDLALAGRHQAANAAVALATLDELRRGGWNVPAAAVSAALATLRWPARVEVIARRPAVVLDTAHNEASIAALVETLRESFSARRRLLVFAASQDKDIRGMLGHLLPNFDEIFFTRYLENPRAVPPEQLAAVATELSAMPKGTVPFSGDCPDFRDAKMGLSPSENRDSPRLGRQWPVLASPAEAWQAARGSAAADDLICITGSFFLAAEVQPLIIDKLMKETAECSPNTLRPQ